MEVLVERYVIVPVRILLELCRAAVDRAPARAMLKGTGFTDADLARPLVGVATSWIETMPCNLNQRDLAAQVKAGIRAR